MIVVVLVLLYLVVSLFIYLVIDFGWLYIGSVVVLVYNMGGWVGVWVVDVLL